MRKSMTMVPALAAALLLGVTSNGALAQRGGSAGGGATAAQGRSVPRGDLDRTQDRLQDRDTSGDQDRERLRDNTGDQDRDQDRDRLQTSQLVDGQLATFSLLTSEERAQFQNEMRHATTAEERNRIRAEHQKMVQERAREMGIEAPAGAGTPMGSQARGGYMLMTMLTDQERAQFMNRMHSAKSEQERQLIQIEMQTMTRKRAHEMGVEVPDWYGRGPRGR